MHGEGEGDRGVEMSARHSRGDVHAHRDREAPGDVDRDVAPWLPPLRTTHATTALPKTMRTNVPRNSAAPRGWYPEHGRLSISRSSTARSPRVARRDHPAHDLRMPPLAAGRLPALVLAILVPASVPPAQTAEPSPPAHARVGVLKITVLSTMLATAGIGEWGFAAIVEADGHRVLFDTGARPDTVLKNAQELKIDLAGVRDVVLSHNHSDHTGGLVTLRQEYAKADAAALSRAWVGRGIFLARTGQTSSGGMPATKTAYESAGGSFVELDAPREIFPGVWLTGPVPRVHPERNWSGRGQVQTAQGAVGTTSRRIRPWSSTPTAAWSSLRMRPRRRHQHLTYARKTARDALSTPSSAACTSRRTTRASTGRPTACVRCRWRTGRRALHGTGGGTTAPASARPRARGGRARRSAGRRHRSAGPGPPRGVYRTRARSGSIRVARRADSWRRRDQAEHERGSGTSLIRGPRRRRRHQAGEVAPQSLRRALRAAMPWPTTIHSVGRLRAEGHADADLVRAARTV